MALINCPYCGQQISEKADTCVYCGAVLKEKVVPEKICPECGEIVKGDATVCPKCGYPINGTVSSEPQKIEVTNFNIKKSSKKKFIILIVAMITIAVVIAGYQYVQNENAKYEYEKNYAETMMLMAEGAAEAEETCNIIHDVWFNCIFKESDSATDEYTKDDRGRFHSDFNDALAELSGSSYYEEKVEKLLENQRSTYEIMRKMKEPPKGYEDAYQALKELFDAYNDFVNMAVNPTGSLTTYTSDINEIDPKVFKLFEAAALYIE